MAKVSETAREREVLKYAAHLCVNTAVREYGDGRAPHGTPSSLDPALAAFAQLGALKLNATRCLISVFDRKSQHILAEATPTSSLDPDNENEGAWLGATTVPRSRTVCEHVLVPTPGPGQQGPHESNPTESPSPSPSPSPSASFELSASIVPDLENDARFCNGPYLLNPALNRFYAGVPIRSPKGINIGVYCVYDDKPREGLDHAQLQFLQEISRTVTRHLVSTNSLVNSRRNERMVRGIGSFVEGKSTMSGWWPRRDGGSYNDVGAEGRLNMQQQSLQGHTAGSGKDHGSDRPTSRPTPAPLQNPATQSVTHSRDESQNPPSIFTSKPHMNSNVSLSSVLNDASAEDPHLNEVKSIFGKAANIIRESIEVEGVLFLDASVGSFGGLVSKGARDMRDSQTSSSDEGLLEESSDPEAEACSFFGYSTSDASSIDERSAEDSYHVNVSEKFLTAIMKRYPVGKIFSFHEDGAALSGDSEEERVILAQSEPPRPPEAGSKNKHSRENEGKSIIRIFPGARSVALVPLWDVHKGRWFAGAFIWTKSPARVFTLEGELSYLRAFGMTIMAQIARTEAVFADKSKSDLLGSISHELRSPLHGIVATVELLQDTALDAFQGDVVHTMDSCGRTLLDVIDHLLDYSRINRIARISKDESKQNRRNRSSSAGRQNSFQSKMTTWLSDVQIDALTEESIESIFTGHNYQKMSIAQLMRGERSGHDDANAMRRHDSLHANDTLGQARKNAGQKNLTLGNVSILLEIDPTQSWLWHTQSGALRRIIMNLFGNSLKYTSSGFIFVSLKQLPTTGRGNRRRSNLKLTISDSGKGIGEDFLRNQIFTPFAQEDQLNPGTGLGLNLVHQMTKTLGGSIQLESQIDRGTTISITLPLSPPRKDAMEDAVLGRDDAALAGLRLSIRGLRKVHELPGLPNSAPPSELEIMENLCRDWLRLEIATPESTARPDLIICSDLSLDEVIHDASTEIGAPTVLICRNAIAAHSLAAKIVRNKTRNVLEFISQPVGPRKIAKALTSALRRWKDANLDTYSPVESRHPAADAQHVPSASVLAESPQDQPSEVGKEGGLANPTAATSSPGGSNTQFSEKHEEVGAPQTEVTQQPQAQNDVQGAVSSAPRDSPEGADGSFTKFLLVDDNKVNLTLLSSFMKKLQQPHENASDGQGALELYMAKPGQFRYVLMDLSMPVMDGLESTRHIREFEKDHQLRPATIVALTGLASASTQQEAFASGVDLFMTKPVRLKQLADLVTDRHSL